MDVYSTIHYFRSIPRSNDSKFDAYTEQKTTFVMKPLPSLMDTMRAQLKHQGFELPQASSSDLSLQWSEKRSKYQ